MLKYPTGRVDRNGMDYVIFEYTEWKPNYTRDLTKKPNALNNRPPSKGHIMLYMPTSTPAVNNKNSWNGKGNDGGILGRIQYGAAAAVGGAAAGDLGNSAFAAGRMVKDVAGNAAQIAAQAGLTATAKKLGVSPSQALQLGSGKILNPNVELFYEGPELRGFSMAFDFVPRSRADQQAMQQIIMEFKHKSAPVPDNNLYKLPQIWQVTYVSGGKVDVMNRFKPAALTDINVQANPDTNMHATYDDGTPIVTSLGLTFMETDVITSEDHKAAGGQGY